MYSALQWRLALFACSLVAPALGVASSIVVNGTTCETGTCPPVDTLSSGGSISSTPFTFTFVAADGDWYNITGDYAATNPASGDTSITFDANVTYVGNGGVNSTPSVAADTFTVTDVQNYDLSSSAYYATYGSLSGYYTEDVTSGSVPAGSAWQAQLFYNNQALPILGPFTGPGYASNGSGTDLTGFGSATTLAADFVFTFDFAQGTAAGTGFTSTPEPGGVIPLMSILVMCLGVGAIRRSRFSKSLV